MATNFTVPDPRLMETADGSAISSGRSMTNGDQTAFLMDRDWTRQAFLMSDTELGNQTDINNRYWTSASVKFTDTRMGANIGVNSRPQFTRYSDCRVKGRLSGRKDVSIQDIGGNHGMGRYYSEAIDDPSQTIYLRFGVPQFSSLTDFFSKAFDPDWVSMARTGRGQSNWATLGRVVGTVAVITAAPVLSAVIYGAQALNWFFSKPTSKFYVLKPTMHMYWSAVGMLVNTIAVNSGILPRIMQEDTGQTIGSPYKFDGDLLEKIQQLLPDVITSNNGFDPFAFATKAQRLANKLASDNYNREDQATATDYTGFVKKDMSVNDRHGTKTTNSDTSGFLSAVTGIHTLGAWIDKTLKFGYYQLDDKSTKTEMKPDTDPATGQPKAKGWWSEFGTYFDAELREGSQFAIFKVDHTGSISESFSNSVTESDLSQKFNSTSAQSRGARFTFADGNIVGGPVGDILGKVGGAITDVASGVLSGVTFGMSDALKGLAGGGFIDIPKHYQSSTASLPKSTYSMQLVSPYGNPISRLQNIYIPLCMIIAGALPLSTGKQSYTSPFLVQLYDQGRCQVQLGLIESVSITRGTSNLAFTKQGKPMAIDVSFSITDLSSIMHMPISTGGFFGANMTMDEDNILMDYLAVLAGQDIYSQIYAMPKGKLKLAKLITQNEKLVSPAYWSSLFHESATSGMMKYLTLGSVSVIEALLPGAASLPGSASR